MAREQQTRRRSRLTISAERRQRVVPLSYQLAGGALNLASLLHNEWASGMLARLWFTVFKAKPKPWVAEFWGGADQRFEIEVADVTIPVYCWGEGPPVVMMHGWSGSGTQFRFFIEPLAAAGFTAVCFDAPEHGSNPGRRSDMPRFSSALRTIEARIGPFHGLIAHSLGAMAATWAVQQGLAPRHTVLIAPHLEAQKMFETFRDLLNMRPALARRFHDKIGARMRELLSGSDAWIELVPARLLDHPGLEGLLVYDYEDSEVSEAQFREMAEIWSDCAVHATRGLGHNRILKDCDVIDAVVTYLQR